MTVKGRPGCTQTKVVLVVLSVPISVVDLALIVRAVLVDQSLENFIKIFDVIFKYLIPVILTFFDPLGSFGTFQEQF